MASCMAEHGLDRAGDRRDASTAPATAPTAQSGAASFSSAIIAGFRRAAHLRYVGMPGGEQAIREPWRMAVAHLDGRRRRDSAAARWTGSIQSPSAPSQAMLERRFNTPLTSSAGRLFDAVASIWRRARSREL